MFKIAFHKQAVSAPLLTASNGDTALTAHELVSVIDSAMQEVGGGASKKLWLSEAACCSFDPSAVTLASSSSDSNVSLVSTTQTQIFWPSASHRKAA